MDMTEEDKAKIDAIRAKAKQASKPKKVGNVKPENKRDLALDEFVRLNSKSAWAAAFLVLLFGPVGYLYVSPVGGFAAILVMIGCASLFFPLAVIFWFFLVVAAPIHVGDKNRKVEAAGALMRS